MLEEAGFDRAVVIVTQDRSYEKKPYEFLPAARARYADYPYLLEAIETRHDRYNLQRMHLWKYEREGRALVVAPQKPVEVGHVEHDPAKLLDLYIQGRQEAKRLLGDIEAFVEPLALQRHGSWMTCAETLVGAKIPVDSYGERGNMDGLLAEPRESL